MGRVTDEKDVHSLRELEKILPHADHLLSSERKKTERAIYISNYLSRHYQKLGKYRLAEKYGLISLDLSQHNFEPGHPNIAIRQQNLALVLKDLGDLEGAKELLQQALATDQQNYEPEHPKIATAQSNLALVLKALGDLEGAKDLSQQAFDAFLNKFGPQHPNTKIAKEILDSISVDK